MKQWLRYSRGLGLMLLLGYLILPACRPDSPAVVHPCADPSLPKRETLLSLAEATRQLQTYLEAKAVIAKVRVREEGAFMLGAYPRSRVLWSIQVADPALTPEDESRLADIALGAYCLRTGWVWLSLTTPTGQTRLISYAQADLETLHHKKGYQ